MYSRLRHATAQLKNLKTPRTVFRAAKAHQASESAKRRATIEKLNANRLDINNQIEGN